MPRAFSDTQRTRIREALLTAGHEAVSRTGFKRTPVETLTRAAGISKGAFYRFFDSKEALFLELLQRAESDLRRQLLGHARNPDLAPNDRLDAVVRLLFGALSDHPILAALTDPEDLAWLERAVPPGAFEAARADDDAWFAALWAELVDGGAGRPDLDPAVFAALAPSALALALGWRGMADPRQAVAMPFLVEAVIAQLRPV